MTTTAKPFDKVNCVTEGAAALSREGHASTAQTARVAKRRINAGTGALKAPVLTEMTGQGAAKRSDANSESLFPAGRAIQDGRDLPAAALLAACPVGVRSRGSLVAGRRLCQGTARRLTGKRSLLIQVGAHQGIPVEDAGGAEFLRAHLSSD